MFQAWAVKTSAQVTRAREIPQRQSMARAGEVEEVVVGAHLFPREKGQVAEGIS